MNLIKKYVWLLILLVLSFNAYSSGTYNLLNTTNYSTSNVNNKERSDKNKSGMIYNSSPGGKRENRLKNNHYGLSKWESNSFNKNEYDFKNLKFPDWDEKIKAYKDSWRKSNPNVVFIPSMKLNFDDLADKYTSTIKNTLDKSGILRFSIILMIIFASIQFAFDVLYNYVYGNLALNITQIVMRRLLQFSAYVFTVKIIFNGTLIKQSLKISYGLVAMLTGEDKIQSLQELWEYLLLFIVDLFNAIGSAWYFDVLKPMKTVMSFGNSLAVSFFLLFVMFGIFYAVFSIIYELFSLLIVIILNSGLSTVFLPLGLIDVTKQYYSIGKIISMIINFIIRLVSINTMAIIGMKAIKEYDMVKLLSDIAQDGITINEILNSDFLVFIMLLFIMVDLMKRIDIQI